MPRRTALLAAALAALAACDGSPTAPRTDPGFTATIRGSVQDELQGTGQFHQIPPDPTQPRPRPGRFVITGGGPFDSRSLMLFREGESLPAPGTYPLAPLAPFAPPAAGARGFTAVYIRRQGDSLEGFTSVEGELRITVSTPARVEGTFRFGGRRNCAGKTVGTLGPGAMASLSCEYPIDPALPAVEVTGSFVATAGPTPPPSS